MIGDLAVLASQRPVELAEQDTVEHQQGVDRLPFIGLQELVADSSLTSASQQYISFDRKIKSTAKGQTRLVPLATFRGLSC